MGVQNAPRLEAVVDNMPHRLANLRKAAKVSYAVLILSIVAIWMFWIPVLLLYNEYLNPDVRLGVGTFFIIASVAGSRERFVETPVPLDLPTVIFFWLLMVTSFAAGSLATSRWLVDRVAAQAASGFHPQNMSVAVNGSDVCPGRSRLLWSGSQSDVIQCIRHDRAPIFLVHRGSENVTYVPHAQTR
jgi:hypothetical protein